MSRSYKKDKYFIEVKENGFVITYTDFLYSANERVFEFQNNLTGDKREVFERVLEFIWNKIEPEK